MCFGVGLCGAGQGGREVGNCGGLSTCCLCGRDFSEEIRAACDTQRCAVVTVVVMGVFREDGLCFTVVDWWKPSMVLL